MKSYTIHLIRHGVCEGNLEGRYVGRTQSPLAREGIQALLELKRKGTYPEAVKYYASPCVRCVDTLKVLYPTADPEVILELAECDFGDWENKKAEELQNDPRFTAWMNGGRHGRIFQDEEIAAYFASMPWYSPQVEPDVFDATASERLSEIEMYNVDVIVQYEDRTFGD